MENNFDVIVLGAGIGGLTAAALLARAGRDVLLLERGDAPGGVFGAYRPAQGEGAYRFALGAAPLDGFEPGGPLADVASLLRVRFPVERQQPALQTWLLHSVVAAPGYQRDALSVSPPDAKRFWRHQERVAAMSQHAGMRSLLFAQRARTVANELRRCHLADPPLLAYIDAQLVALGLPPAERCPWLAGSAALDMPRRGLFTATGGPQAVAAVLADAFVRDGGELRFGTALHELLLEEERVRGVRAADGAEYLAPHVVLATPQPALLSHAFYAALDAAAVPAEMGCYHRVALDAGFVALTISPAQDADRAPTGERLVTAILPDNLHIASETKPQDVLAAAVERVLPGALARARLRYYAEPVALARVLDAAPSLGAAPPGVKGIWSASDGGIVNAGSAAAALAGIAASEGIERALNWDTRRRELALLRQSRASARPHTTP